MRCRSRLGATRIEVTIEANDRYFAQMLTLEVMWRSARFDLDAYSFGRT